MEFKLTQEKHFYDVKHKNKNYKLIEVDNLDDVHKYIVYHEHDELGLTDITGSVEADDLITAFEVEKYE
jgi:hypothetical protein